MKIFQKFMQLYLLFGAINIMHSTHDCHCHEDCEALANFMNQQNQLRTKPGPDKKLIQNQTDTSTCKRNTKCCVPAPTCRKGWIKNEGRCFLFKSCAHGCTVNKARSACTGEQAQLAKVSSAAQEKFFIRSLNKGIIILGGHMDRDDIWRWPDKSLFSDGYTNLHSGYPRIRSGDCMVMFRATHTWYNGACKSRFSKFSQGYICESSPV